MTVTCGGPARRRRRTRSSTGSRAGPASWRRAAMPLVDPDPVERTRVASAAPPSHYEQAVERAVERIRAGELEKVVLAREVRAHAPARARPRGGPRRAEGAVPRLLLLVRGHAGGGLRRREPGAARAPRRPAGPDRRPRRHDAPQRRSRRRRPPRRAAAPQRQGPRGAGHRGAPHRAHARPGEPLGGRGRRAGAREGPQRAAPGHADPRAASRSAYRRSSSPGMLLPTPAVGGEPREAALPLIPALEGLDRGWYAGAVGWTDLAEDGEFCVALRCALLRGRVAHLYAGCGIVRDSVPARGARRDRGQAPGAAAARFLKHPPSTACPACERRAEWGKGTRMSAVGAGLRDGGTVRISRERALAVAWSSSPSWPSPSCCSGGDGGYRGHGRVRQRGPAGEGQPGEGRRRGGRQRQGHRRDPGRHRRGRVRHRRRATTSRCAAARG